MFSGKRIHMAYAILYRVYTLVGRKCGANGGGNNLSRLPGLTAMRNFFFFSYSVGSYTGKYIRI